MAAYNPYYSANYPNAYPYSQPNFPQQMQPVPTPQQPITQPQIQNGGFVFVQSENEARLYPVAPGNSVTFKDENAPFVYEKTMGFSQLDRPQFKKFRLIEEADMLQNIQNTPISAPSAPQANSPDYALRSDLEALTISFKTEIDSLKNNFESLTAKKTTAPKVKKETESNE